MIVLDIETTGTDAKENCMVSLGAVEYYSGREYYSECRIWPEAKIDPIALSINGFTEEQIRDPYKQSPEQLYLDFVRWATPFKPKTLAGHNIGHLDILFLEEIHRRVFNEGLATKWLFGYRTIDLHSVAYTRFRESLSHPDICTRLNLPIEPKPHNALNGARSEAAAFRLLLP